MDYQGYHRQLLQQFLASVESSAPFAGNTFSEQDHAFLSRLRDLSGSTTVDEAFFSEGQALLCQVVATYPHLTPVIPRDLLWYFSGDCLHFLSDEEIDVYSQLDEIRFEAEKHGATFNMAEAKQTIRKWH
ncbi:MAG TPA: PA2817 family protein [Pseudomonadales bacterium]|nr:PA2817 family protein [Pseudomonadales bacterium]